MTGQTEVFGQIMFLSYTNLGSLWWYGLMRIWKYLSTRFTEVKESSHNSEDTIEARVSIQNYYFIHLLSLLWLRIAWIPLPPISAQ